MTEITAEEVAEFLQRRNSDNFCEHLSGYKNLQAIAPAMAALIAKQDAEIKRLRDALEHLHFCVNKNVPFNQQVILEALATTNNGEK